MKKAGIIRLFLLAAAALLLLFLAYRAFLSPSAQTIQSAEKDSTLTQIAILPVVECLPLMASDTTRIHLQPFDAAMDADTAFLRKHADAIMTDLVKAITWHEKDSNIVVLFCYSTDLRMMASRQGRLFTAKQLKDRIIGMTRNSSLDFLADEMLKSAQLQPADLNRPQINKISLRMSMLTQNQYDGALLPQPYASMAAARGGTLVRAERMDSTLSNIGAFVVWKNLNAQKISTLMTIKENFRKESKRIENQFKNENYAAVKSMNVATDYADSIFHDIQAPRVVDADAKLVDRISQWCIDRSLIKRPVSLPQLLMDQP